MLFSFKKNAHTNIFYLDIVEQNDLTFLFILGPEGFNSYFSKMSLREKQ